MNELPSTNSGNARTTAQASGDERVAAILRSTAKNSKITFGAHRGTFDLEKRDVENFFHLVDQRVREQNSVAFENAEFCVYYNDGSSRRFAQIQGFIEYAETRRRYPTVVTIHMVYFLNFPDSTDHEKQEIDIAIRASESTSETIDMVEKDDHARMTGDKVQVTAGSDDSQYGVISYNINHSRISWGLDLEGHIRGHVESILIEPTKTDKLIRLAAGPLNLLTTLFVGLYLVNLIIDGFFWFLFATDGASDPQQVIEIASTYLINGNIAKYIVATLVVSFVFFVIFSGLVSRFVKSLYAPRPSFLSLDEKDHQRKALRIGNYNRRWVKLAGLVMVNVVTGIAVAALEGRITAWLL